MATILIVDDEKNIREGLNQSLMSNGFKTLMANNGQDGLFMIMNESVDLAILDIQMPKTNGIDLFKKIITLEKDIPVIFITGHGSVELAVDAMRLGAYDFITKPINLEKLELIVQRALKQKNIEKENQTLIVKLNAYEMHKSIIGESKAIKHLTGVIERVAPSKANVYICGESGTGKELVCDAIHSISGRNQPLVKVNCAALSPTLLESELFGHVKGAFTGADSHKVGRFEQANHGILFLDEISEVPTNIQVKLLRVLQEKEIERVGSGQPIPLDIRIISASNKDLKKEVEKGNFREDFFYRLNVIDIYVPPLREREKDVILLASHFFKTFCKANKKHLDVTPQFFSALDNYHWPGNIRQLSNVIEKVVVLNQTGKVTIKDLPAEIKKDIKVKETIEITLGQTLEEIEKKVIDETIRYCNGNKSEAAKVLGIGRKTLYRNS
ncbi:regulatory protein AtoC-like [Ylistrum balloti]|uniref:regulatory protein AtoC-like n=1 Tax=Ylistrum balloti TaxID=509963 RepID=UPI002905CE98|nr:regulatory protein AtoC-like [Ylistrum balloti]